MSSSIYLYLKTHNVTGLKYLGQTTKDPFKYTGSGKHWLRHIKKHGNDVKTQILLETSDKEELRKHGMKYSIWWNVVESEDFANLMNESGNGGALGHKSGMFGKKHTNESKMKMSESTKGKDHSGKKNPMYGKKHSEEARRKMSVSHVDIRGENNPMYGKKHSEETRRKISEALRKRNV